ncbi:MLO-like protein 11 [Glycine soja]
MEENSQEKRSLALTPTWSVATVLTVFVAVSLLVERSIHHLSNRLRKTNRKPLLAALEKMKEELMLLGFISLLLTATSRMIANICIPSKFYNSAFASCTRSEIDEEMEDNSSEERKLLMASSYPHLGYEPFVSYEGLEQLHRFIFVMAVTHISYSCLTMLLAIVKIHSWRVWEDEAHMDRHNSLTEITKELTMRRQSTFVKSHASNPLNKNSSLIWVTCFFRQFGHSVVLADYLTLRKGFIMNHNLSFKYDFHSYMIRSMEEEFQRIVGVSGPLWGFVIAFMLFNIKGSNLYFWIAIIPVSLVLLVGTKLQHVIATLALENAGITRFFPEAKLRPRDELFWFNKPELLLSLIHFILFQNAFELASFFWFWWQFGYYSCFIRNHLLLYIRLKLGLAGQFLCSYSTLPLYALVTQFWKYQIIPPNQSQKNDDLEPVHRWIVVKFVYHVRNTISSILTVGNFDIMSELREKPFALYPFSFPQKPRAVLVKLRSCPPNQSQKNDDLEPVHRWIVVKFVYHVRNTISSILTVGNFDIMSELREKPFALYPFSFPQKPRAVLMGTNYKAALIPQRIRETIHGWGKAARRKRRHGMFTDDSTIHTDTSTVLSIEEDDQLIDTPEVELQPATAVTATPSPIANETSSRAVTPLLRPSASISSVQCSSKAEAIPRCSSMPSGR